MSQKRIFTETKEEWNVLQIEIFDDWKGSKLDLNDRL